jgi:hypothetical protein
MERTEEEGTLIKDHKVMKALGPREESWNPEFGFNKKINNNYD